MNFHYLALFICHLFGDGRFRTVHILFKPSAFNYSLLNHIDSVCPDPIPLYLTDITKPWEWPWNQNDNPNNVLQLLFFDPKTLSKDGKQLKKGLAFYRIFAFSTTDVIQTKTQVSIAKRLRKFSDSNMLILNYDAKNVSVYIDYGLSGVSRQKSKPIFIINKNTNFKRVNLFDHTFGKYERMQSVAIKSYGIGNSVDDFKKRAEKYINLDTSLYDSNYLNLFLNKSYIYLEWWRDTGLTRMNFMRIPNHPKYYKEISNTSQIIPHNHTL